MVNNRRNSFTLMYLFSVGAYWHVISCCFLTELWLFVLYWVIYRSISVDVPLKSQWLLDARLSRLHRKQIFLPRWFLFISLYHFIFDWYYGMHSSLYGHGFPPSGKREVLMMWCSSSYLHTLGLFYQIIQVLHHVAASAETRGSFRLYWYTVGRTAR